MYGAVQVYRKAVVNPRLLKLSLVSRSYYGYFLALVISLHPALSGFLVDKRTYRPISKRKLMRTLNISSRSTMDLFLAALRENKMIEEVDCQGLTYFRITVLPEYQRGVKDVDKAMDLLGDLLTGKISLDQIRRKPVRKKEPSKYKIQVIEDHIKGNYPAEQYLLEILIEKLKLTRSTKKINENKLIEILTAMVPYPHWKVIQGIHIYLSRRYWAEKKDERYLMGIIRGQKIPISIPTLETIELDLKREYGFQETWDKDRVEYMMKSVRPKIEERWKAYIDSLK